MVADDPSVELLVATVPAGVPAESEDTDMLAKPVLVLVAAKLGNRAGVLDPDCGNDWFGKEYECVCPASVAVCV